VGTRTQKKQRKTELQSEPRGLERWQVLLAAVITAVGGIAVALLAFLPGGSSGHTDETSGPGPSQVTASPSQVTASRSQVATQPNYPAANFLPTIPNISIAISGEVEQPYPPPPGRKYIWNGTVHGEPMYSQVYMIDIRTGAWLVSPLAKISPNGAWTVTWVISNPPVSADWLAVVVNPVEAQGAVSGVCTAPCPSASAFPGWYGLSSSLPGVLASATYSPQA
jgi:hypothetical protein